MKKKNLKKGMMLAEILVATFIFSIILGILITINNLYLTSTSSGLKSVKALYLAEEGMEALRIIKDTGWVDFQNLLEEEEYFFNLASSTFEATTSLSYKSIDNINRWFVIKSVSRENGKIVQNNGVVDENTKKVTVYVSWQDRSRIVTKSFGTYLTKIISD